MNTSKPKHAESPQETSQGQFRVVTPIDELIEAHNQLLAARQASDWSLYFVEHEFNFSRIYEYLSYGKLNKKEVTTYPVPNFNFTNSSWVNIEESASYKLIIVINDFVDSRTWM